MIKIKVTDEMRDRLAMHGGTVNPVRADAQIGAILAIVERDLSEAMVALGTFGGTARFGSVEIKVTP